MGRFEYQLVFSVKMERAGGVRSWRQNKRKRSTYFFPPFVLYKIKKGEKTAKK